MAITDQRRRIPACSGTREGGQAQFSRSSLFLAGGHSRVFNVLAKKMSQSPACERSATIGRFRHFSQHRAQLVFLLLLTILAARAQAAQRDVKADAKRPFRENATLPVDNNLPKQFGTVEDLLADRRWTEAIRILQEITQTESKSLVLVQPGKSGGVALYLNVSTRCNVLLSRIPIEGRVAYRQKIDPQAKRWFENWQRTRDEAELLRIVRQAFLSSYGDDALSALGEAAWDRGDFSAARLWWEQLVPLPVDANPEAFPMVLRYPDAEQNLESVLARIVLCSILANEPARAAEELAQFAERYPQAEGRLGNQTGRYVEMLRQLLNDAKNWTPLTSAEEVATFGYSSERNRRLTETCDVGALRWFHPLPVSFQTQSLQERLPLSPEPLSYHPVVCDLAHEKIVLINDASSIRAWISADRRTRLAFRGR